MAQPVSPYCILLARWVQVVSYQVGSIIAMLAGAFRYLYIMAFVSYSYVPAGSIICVYLCCYLRPVLAFSKWSCTPIGYRQHKYMLRLSARKANSLVQ